jgi:hypothetical protein
MVRGVVIACLIAGACGGGARSAAPPPEPIANRQPAPEAHPAPAPAHGTPSEQALAMMNALAEQMCACSDSQCIQVVSEKLTTWAQDMAKDTEQMKMSDDEQKVAAQIGRRMGECIQRAMGNGTNPPPPPSP